MDHETLQKTRAILKIKEFEVSGATLTAAQEAAAQQLGMTTDMLAYDVVDKGSRGFLGFGKRSARIRVRQEQALEPLAYARHKLQRILSGMQIAVAIEEQSGSEPMILTVSGADISYLTNNHDRLKDAIQYLVNLMVIRALQRDYRIQLHIAGRPALQRYARPRNDRPPAARQPSTQPSTNQPQQGQPQAGQHRRPRRPRRYGPRPQGDSGAPSQSPPREHSRGPRRRRPSGGPSQPQPRSAPPTPPKQQE